MLVHANGRIKTYMMVLGTINAGRCLAVFVLMWAGIPLITSLWLGFFLPFFIITQSRILFIKHEIGNIISIRHYIYNVFVPVCLMIVASFAFSFGFKMLYGDSVPVIIASLAGNALIVAALFWLVIGKDERNVLTGKAKSALAMLRHKI